MSDWQDKPPIYRLNPNDLCGYPGCQRTRAEHWGRKNALAPQRLGHQWRPLELELKENPS